MRTLVLFFTFVLLSVAYPRGSWKTSYTLKPLVHHKKIKLSPHLLRRFVKDVIAEDSTTGKREKNSISSLVLSQLIIGVADCFEIDPFFLSGLVYGESRYNVLGNSKANAFAVGLTQMTSTGIREVNDQIGYFQSEHARERGINNKRNARSEVVKYFSQKLNSCISPLTHEGRWIQIWERAEPGHDMANYDLYTKKVIHKDTPKETSVFSWTKENSHYARRFFKRQMLSDPLTSLVYGAVLLKVKLSEVIERSKEKKEMSDYYYAAIRAYNSATKYQMDTLESNARYAIEELVERQKEFDSHFSDLDINESMEASLDRTHY